MDTPNKTHDRPLAHSANTSKRHGSEVSPSTTLHGNHSLDISGPVAQNTSTPIDPHEKSPTDEEATDILMVDWDGPDDPQNPKKYVR